MYDDGGVPDALLNTYTEIPSELSVRYDTFTAQVCTESF